MMNLQSTLDKAAIGISILCAIHCLLLPVAMVMGVSTIPFGLDNEMFHKWLIVAIIPTSLVALAMGCRKHKRHRVYVWGAIGILFLVGAATLGHDFGEAAEKVLTLIGGAFIIIGHVSNYQLCRKLECDCSSDSVE